MVWDEHVGLLLNWMIGGSNVQMMTWFLFNDKSLIEVVTLISITIIEDEGNIKKYLSCQQAYTLYQNMWIVYNMTAILFLTGDLSFFP